MLATLLPVFVRLAAVLVVEGFLLAAALADVALAAPTLPRPLLAVADRVDVVLPRVDFAAAFLALLVSDDADLAFSLLVRPVADDLEVGFFCLERVVRAAVDDVDLRVVRRAAGVRLLGGLVSPVSAMALASFHPSAGELSPFEVLLSDPEYVQVGPAQSLCLFTVKFSFTMRRQPVM